jgi:hypothetical protein
MDLTLAQVKSTLWKTKFTFAKTMPKIPHEWSHRKDWYSDESFENIVKYIRENGVKEKFYKKEFTYLYVNGYKYWTMGNPIKTTIILNRAKVIEDKNDL